jgi:hypothetical protein
VYTYPIRKRNPLYVCMRFVVIVYTCIALLLFRERYYRISIQTMYVRMRICRFTSVNITYMVIYSCTKFLLFWSIHSRVTVTLQLHQAVYNYLPVVLLESRTLYTSYGFHFLLFCFRTVRYALLAERCALPEECSELYHRIT